MAALADGIDEDMSTFDYDVLVIGSGFGGSVTALRLAEKGYRVGVLEAGRRFDDPHNPIPGDRHRALPKTSWRARRYLWAPRLGLTGIQRIHLLRGARGSRVLVLAGAGVGGGSLVYANTLYVPPPPFFDDPQWRHITDWHAELMPFYDQAKRMLGVTANPTVTAADRAIRRVAERMGRGKTFRLTPVGVFFGDKPGAPAADPYFGGAGPQRAGCTECGSCMTGCRRGAKNMLTENYLYLAERAGAAIIPMTTVTAVWPGASGYHVEVRRTAATPRARHTLTARHVVFAAGTYGTQRLLHRMKAMGALPHLSARLGALTRTNSEALLGVERLRSRGDDHSRGLAITSSFHPDEQTHIEPTRYGPGSNAMGALATLLVDGGGRAPRWAKFLGYAATHPWDLARLVNLRNWSRRTVIALVMQTRDNSVTVAERRGLFGWGLRSAPGHGEPNPTWIPVGAPRGAHAGRGTGRDGGRYLARPGQHPVDRALHRRLRHRRLGGDRGHRRVPPGLRARRPAHRGRVGGVREPGRQPGADHHRPGGAGHVDVAQPRRGRSPSRPRRALPEDRAGPAEQPRRPARCACGTAVYLRAGQETAGLRPADPDRPPPVIQSFLAGVSI